MRTYTMKTPPNLRKGDTVAIVSTARKITKEELDPAINLLHGWGLHVILGDSIEASDNQFAGSDSLRGKDFQRMLDNPEVNAIWCARGGYGTVRIIDILDFSAFEKNPKWIVGYSDVTVLHSQIHKLGFQTLHAQMPLEIQKKSEATTESLRKALFGEGYDIAFSSRHSLNREGMASGKLVGGNLSMLYSLCGSPTALDTTGKILFLEDLDEYLYHVDRMMQNLKRNGMLDHLEALIVGGMSDMNDNSIPFGKNAEEIIWDAVKDYTYPVYFGCPAGHIHDNQCLIFGKEITVQAIGDTVKIVF